MPSSHGGSRRFKPCCAHKVVSDSYRFTACACSGCTTSCRINSSAVYPNGTRPAFRRASQEAKSALFTRATDWRVFGGATAYLMAKGVWRDDKRGGALVVDEPAVVNCYTTPA